VCVQKVKPIICWPRCDQKKTLLVQKITPKFNTNFVYNLFYIMNYWKSAFYVVTQCRCGLSYVRDTQRTNTTVLCCRYTDTRRQLLALKRTTSYQPVTQTWSARCAGSALNTRTPSLRTFCEPACDTTGEVDLMVVGPQFGGQMRYW
jgi:hypothetical protein